MKRDNRFFKNTAKRKAEHSNPEFSKAIANRTPEEKEEQMNRILTKYNLR